MALSEDAKKNAGFGIFVGIGAVLLAPVLLPILASAARPLARTAIKGGLMLYDKGKEKMAEAGEVFEDLVAEVRDELSREFQAAYAYARDVAQETSTEEGVAEAAEVLSEAAEEEPENAS